MGTYDIHTKVFHYKNPEPKSNYGVIAPYIVKYNINTSMGDQVFNIYKSTYILHKGYWFDIGDYKSILLANNYIIKKLKNKF